VAPSLDTIGLLSASLDDLQSVFDWLVPRPPPSGKSKWRLLAIRTQGHEQIDEPVRALFCNATASFPRSIDVDGWDSPAAQAFDTAVQSADELIHDIMCCEMQWPYAGYARNPGGGLSDHIKQMVEKGARMSPSYAQQLQRLRNDLRATMREALTGYDGAVTLSASGVAPPGLDYSGSRSFPVPWSLMGGPSLSVPLLRHENLPIGIQLMMLPGQDHDVLDLAHLLA
jgi:Asp-tRNA(Asn)/Glu-tRNA(Gln) amidotransferase A subunit family amidase